MQKDLFYGYKENQAHYGYRSAILYKEEGATKYQFLCASETVPFPFGTKETSDFNLMNSPVVGKVEGKTTLEQKEVELLYTRNNAILFEKLKDKVLDFMSLTPQLIGYKFSGTISFRPNDATSDIHRGTYTITPMDADHTPYHTARNDVLNPLFFNNAIPDEISIASLASTASTVDINIGVRGIPSGESVQYSYTIITKDDETGREAEGAATPITATNGVIGLPKTAGLYVIYATPGKTSSGNNFTKSTTTSGCFTTIYITA